MSRAECPLCHYTADWFYTDHKFNQVYFHCSRCDMRFLDPALRLSPEQEIERYQLHKNDVREPDYQNYSAPLVNEILRERKPGELGLDYGSGAEGIMSHMLRG